MEWSQAPNEQAVMVIKKKKWLTLAEKEPVSLLKLTKPKPLNKIHACLLRYFQFLYNYITSFPLNGSINVNGPINGGEITLTNSNETSSKLAEKRTQADQS